MRPLQTGSIPLCVRACSPRGAGRRKCRTPGREPSGSWRINASVMSWLRTKKSGCWRWWRWAHGDPGGLNPSSAALGLCDVRRGIISTRLSLLLFNPDLLLSGINVIKCRKVSLNSYPTNLKDDDDHHIDQRKILRCSKLNYRSRRVRERDRNN